ncbi:MAG: pyruvate carboxylase subunit B [Clostridiales bacterium]|nr:pyruvate carboxylase subunit B [Clostridiales bacterium]
MKVQFTETMLRDANQSLVATRIPYEKFDGILETMDKAGYYSMECWGGATFDACLRYLDEDPWERLRKIKAKCPNTKLQMLLRGQNLLGYKHYPDDVVRLFVKKSIENGIDVIRIFDALNDTRNLKVAVDETLKNGAIASGSIAYTTSPVHTLEKYVELAKELKAMGCQTIGIKDMAGVMTPAEAHNLILALKDAVPDLPLVLHTHCTTGMAYLTILDAVESGCDIIDTATSCFSGGTSQPATETLYEALTGLGYETGLDRDILKKVNDHFKPIRDEYLKSGLLKAKALVTDTDALSYKVPGGMLSNMIANLEDMHAIDHMEEALVEIPRVRQDMGYPPLVTPLSQMVGNQAVTNVLLGKRYKNISKEIKAYIRGEYGKAPGEINPDLQKKVLGDEKPFTGRFADTLPPAVEKARKELGARAKCDEDVLSYICFPQTAEKFFEKREEKLKHSYKYEIEAVEEES